MSTTDSTRPNDPLIGAWLLDQFQIVDIIGEGGMGRVYRANQVAMGRSVAIKVVRIADEQMRRRFRNEARTMSRLVHPNLVMVYNFGEAADGALFLAMEYVPGKPLDALIRAAPLPLMQAVNIAHQCASALECAHGVGIIHRDLKPENIVVTNADGRDHVKLLDFGLAHWTEERDVTPHGRVVGTPQYMSPEQCRGDVATALSDQYALGLVLYEMVAGTHAFDADNALAYMLMQQQRPVPHLRRDGQLIEQIDSIIQRMTAKDPKARFARMREIQAALEPVGAKLVEFGRPSHAETLPPLPVLPRAAERAQPRVLLFGRDQPLRSSGKETAFDVGFDVIARLGSLQPGRIAGGSSDSWVVRTSEEEWDSTSTKLRASGVNPARMLVAIDAPVESPSALASITRLSHVMISRHPADPTPIGVNVRWMQQPDASLLESIASFGVQLIRVTAPHVKSAYVNAIVEDLAAQGIRARAQRAVKSVAEEMIMNAIFHAPVDANGTKTYVHLDRSAVLTLSEREQPIVQWAIGDQHIALSVRDRFGSLTAGQIIAALRPRNQINQGTRSLTAGLGLSMMSRAARHLFFAVAPGQSCEVFALIDREPPGDALSMRSLSILQAKPRGEEKLGDLLWIQESRRDRGVHLTMQGEINETSDFSTIFRRSGDVSIDLAGVSAINSSGVLAWMRAYQRRNKALRLLYERCPAPLVYQFATIKDLASSGKIVSVQLPYYCGRCKKELLEVIDSPQKAIPRATCPDCGTELEFGDIPELYLSLLVP
jgi:serine/threonine protein kinase